MNLLAGDIGGTKTVLALFSTEQGPYQPAAIATFHSGDYPSLEAIVGQFLQGQQVEVSHAAFGVAGPVVSGRARITNLPWIIDHNQLATTFGFHSVSLLNDLEAIAVAIPILRPADLETINPGQPQARGAMAVVAAGTGLGEAFLLWNGHQYISYPSEGGHASFAPTNPTQLALLDYLWSQFGHVSFERVCSGLGIPNLYAFLRDTGRYSEPTWLAEERNQSEDPTRTIVQNGLEGQAPICVATLDLFVQILAAEASNLAIKILATGGVYIGGGIPPRLVSQLKSPAFMEAFTHKGRFSSLLQQMPVHIILNSRAGLVGAAWHGLNQ